MNPLKRLRIRLQKLESAISSLSNNQISTKDHIEEMAATQLQHHNNLEESIYRLKKDLERADANFTHLVLPERGTNQNILIVGFFGAFNLGDELILETTLTTLRKTHPAAKITIMLADNYSCDITRYGDYDFIHYPNTPLEINSIARHFDAVIFPGGAIIDDVEYSLRKRPLTLGAILVTLSLRFIALNKPCILYGLSTNTSLSNKDFVEKVNLIAKGATNFSLRDKNSLLTLDQAGVDTSKISIVDDVVITNTLINNKIQSNGEIGLIFIYTEDLYGKIVTFTHTLLQTVSKTTKLKLILFYDYEDNDLLFAKRLVNEINDPRLEIESESIGNYKETVSQIGSKDTVFSMRYHGTLLANFLGKRTVCLNYSQHRHYLNKNSYLYSHYGFTKHIINTDEINTITSESLAAMLKSEVKNIDTPAVQTESYKRLVKILKGIK